MGGTCGKREGRWENKWSERRKMGNLQYGHIYSTVQCTCSRLSSMGIKTKKHKIEDIASSILRMTGTVDRVGHPFFSKECSVLCVLLHSL